MSEIPQKLIVNLEDGTQTYVDFTPDEIATREQDRLNILAMEAQEKEKQDALFAARKSANDKLTALGLTAEEIAALSK